MIFPIERNNGVYFRGRKILWWIKEQARARVSGEKSGLVWCPGSSVSLWRRHLLAMLCIGVPVCGFTGLPSPVAAPHGDLEVAETRRFGNLRYWSDRALHDVEIASHRPSLHFSPGFVTRATKRKYPLGLSRIGRRSRSCATSRSTI